MRAAHTELERVITAIREVEAEFLRPPSFDRVQQAAQTASVLYIAATEAGGIALQVRQDASTIGLPLLDEDSLQQAVKIYLDDYRAWQQAKPAERKQAAANWLANLDGLSKWLGKVLEPLWQQLEPDSELVLIPVGLLNLLPLHLARIGDDYALDKFCIRYTPNARALAEASKLNIPPGNILDALLFPLAGRKPAAAPSPAPGAAVGTGFVGTGENRVFAPGVAARTSRRGAQGDGHGGLSASVLLGGVWV